MNDTTLYDTDILTWSERQAELLRRVGAGEQINDQIDWANVAEEIESVGASQRSARASHVRNIIEHLAKLEASPASDPRNGWKETIVRIRDDLDDLLKGSPSLKEKLPDVVKEQLPKALRRVALALTAHGETPTIPLYRISYTADQVTGEWFPADHVDAP